MLYLQKATQVTFSPDNDLDGLADLYAYPSDLDGSWLRVNMVSTLDGASAFQNKSGGLGGAGDKAIFRVLRGLCDVVLVGARTATAEGYGQPEPDTAFTERRSAAGQRPAPRLALTTRSLTIDPDFAPLRDPGTVVITTAGADPERRARLVDAGATLVDCGDDSLDPHVVTNYLAASGSPRILCEGGPSLLGSFVDADLVDELCLTISPNLVSGDAPRIAHSDNDDAALHRLRPVHLLTDTDGYVFSRWSR
ncbi:pyrimidine reductase family protein [Gordonia otitidis]|uniref:Bacterial bifunctional deaminase-reductase C-terminal domain-containing protein n=1 Tax=Gordonia otitidis (strain DSM 44809 / CCUG 52243 / JCM 12355 / NBRC 100426 / IFM 10032) TaxID=1108044 RepID=H5TRX5_GORO1|nr:pyrimidine reductase family protein [Gordonia otitidis]GAB36233.1 hypothetical protein GOOTI_204_00110 [Gordonia otitidis NBRC 100426]